MPSPLTDLLNSYPELDNKQKRELWDIYSQSRDINTLADRLKASSAPQRVKAQVWNLKAGKPTTPGFTEKTPPEQEGPPYTPPPSVGGFLGNVATSTGNLIQGVAGAVTSPVQTAKALGNLGLGIAESVIPGEQGHEPYARALVDMYKKRYGSWDNFTHTLYTDPVGAAADLATVAGGAGGALKGLGLVSDALKLGKTGAFLSDVGEVASTVGGVADPMKALTYPMKGALKVGGKLTNKLNPEALYQSALKPPLTKKGIPEIPEIVQTGLEAGIPVSKSGAETLSGLIDDLNDKIADLVKTKGAGKYISPEEVAKRTEDVATKFGEQVNPEADLAAISSSKSEFLAKHGAQPSGATGPQIAGFDVNGNPIMAPSPAVPAKPISVADAQAEKVGTYRQLRKKYGELGDASIESQKALARGLKEEVATAIPELAELNEKESKFLGLDAAFERAVARVANRDLTGIGTPIAVAAGKAATGSNKAAVVAGLMKAILDNPDLKSRLAIALNRAQKLNPGKYGIANMATATSRIESYIKSLSPETATAVPTP